MWWGCTVQGVKLTRIEDGTSAASVSPRFRVECPLAPEDLQLCGLQDLLDLHTDFCMGAFVMSWQDLCLDHWEHRNSKPGIYKLFSGLFYFFLGLVLVSGWSSEDKCFVTVELAQCSLLGSPGSEKLLGSRYIPTPMGRNAASCFGHGLWNCQEGVRSHFPPEFNKPFVFLISFGNQLDLGMDLEALLASASSYPVPVLLLCRAAKSKFSGGQPDIGGDWGKSGSVLSSLIPAFPPPGIPLLSSCVVEAQGSASLPDLYW